MKVFGDPRARAKARRYIVWCAEDVLFCTGLFGGIALAGWVFHVVFAALGVACRNTSATLQNSTARPSSRCGA